ncbi:phage portal protein [Roseinatronobacter sp.]
MAMMTGFRKRLGAWVGGFEAALGNRRLKGFRPARAHVNALLAAAGPEMNARARWLVRNNGYAANAVESWAANAVGDGIKPSARIAQPRHKLRIQELFLDWTDEADAEGLTDFYGLQRRVAREVFITGEAFLRFRPRRPTDGLRVPLQLQMMPTEMLPTEMNRPADIDGHVIRQGIEFDRIGRRVAYHFYRRHPSDPTEPGLKGEKVRVPASDVIHVLDPVEAGQLRGVSRFAAAIVKLLMLDQYDDAELDRKKVAALYAMFVTNALGEDEAPLMPEEGDDLEVAPGSIVNLLPGQDVTVASPADSGATYEPFQFRTLMQVAASLGLPYAYLTGDVARGNFSNSRLSLMEFRRRVSSWQHSVMVYQMCLPVWQRWMDVAVLSGALALPSYERRRAQYQACAWLPTKWDWVDPLKDTHAELAQISAGLKSRTQAVSERGYDAEVLDREIAAERARERELGLDFRQPGSPAQGPSGGSGSGPSTGERRLSQDDDAQDDDPDEREDRE